MTCLLPSAKWWASFQEADRWGVMEALSFSGQMAVFSQRADGCSLRKLRESLTNDSEVFLCCWNHFTMGIWCEIYFSVFEEEQDSFSARKYLWRQPDRRTRCRIIITANVHWESRQVLVWLPLQDFYQLKFHVLRPVWSPSTGKILFTSTKSTLSMSRASLAKERRGHAPYSLSPSVWREDISKAT